MQKETPNISKEFVTPKYKPIPARDYGKVRIAQSSLNNRQIVIVGGGFQSYHTYNIDTAVKMATKRRKHLQKKQKALMWER